LQFTAAFDTFSREVSAMLPTRGVLVVEDDKDLRTLFGMLLEAEGFRVFQANDGQAGLDTLSANAGEIGIVITDLGLPRVGGVDLIARVRAGHPEVKIIGTSGYGAKDVRAMVLAAGADEFYPKPFSVPELINKVKSFGT
jgi:DNA-binding response OmpR family regulator